MKEKYQRNSFSHLNLEQKSGFVISLEIESSRFSYANTSMNTKID